MSPLLFQYGVFGVVAAGLFGLVVGSFVNVLIHRLPRGESVIRPASHCPACGETIRPLENIPLASWIYLKGRCRACRVRISLRYPATELGNALLWALLFSRAPSFADFLSGAFLASACLALLAIDAEFQILPDAITLPGIAAGIALSFFSATRSPLASFVGAALGGGLLYLLGYAYRKIQRVEGMGFGDVKMLAMVGAFLGPTGVLVTVLVASLSGSAVGLALIALGRGDRKTRLPFGVFLAAGALAALFFGPGLIERYTQLVHSAGGR